VSATSQSWPAKAEASEANRALKSLKDPASPRMILEVCDLRAASARPWWRCRPRVMLAGAVRPSVIGALAWSGFGLLTCEALLWLRPDLAIDWPAILTALVAVLTPLVSITIPLAVHAVRQRGRLVAEYYSQTCRLNVFCGVAVAGLLLGIASLICFRLTSDQAPDRWAIALGPSVALGLTVASMVGLAYILFATLACTGPDGRLRASRFLAARLAGKAIQGRSLEEELTLVYADLALLMADADLASFRALVQSLAQVPRCYTRFAARLDGLQLELLWGSHIDVMGHVVGRGAYSTSASKHGPIAARFADEHAQALSGELMACVGGADPQNLAAASRTIQWFYGLLHSAKSDQNLPREVSDALYGLRGSAAFYYLLPESLLGHLPSQTDAATTASIIQILQRGIMALVVEAAERKDHDIVDAVSKGVADLYAAAEKRLSDLGESRAAKLVAYDYWILLGHFVAHAIDGAEGAWGTAMALHEPFKQCQPLDLMKTFVSLPEPTWDHPVYVQQQQARSAWIRINPVTHSGSGAWAIGHPGGELNAAFAFLIARSWRMLQPAPAVVPCPHDLGEVKKRLDGIFAKADGWQLSLLDQDKPTVHRWLDDCTAAHRAIESAKYLATPLSETKKREFEQNLRAGFWEGAVLLQHISTLVSEPADGGGMLRCWAIHGPRSLYFGDGPDPDIARFGHDAGADVATSMHQVVIRRWCEAVTASPVRPVNLERSMVEASDWLGPQEGWDGLIVVVGPYELKARVEALPDYRPHATQADYSREFFGTHRGHPLLWLRTDQDDATRRFYAFRLSALRREGAGGGAAPSDVDRSVWPKVIFKEAGDLAAEYRDQGQDQDAQEVAKRPGDVYVIAELGHLSDAMPEGRMWDVSEGTAPPTSTGNP